MSGCSLVAAGLPSLIGTATPTFSYDHAKHTFGSGDDFGIQMTYMLGTSTCYQGTKPTLTPIISNPYLLYTRTCSYVTQGVPATYTGIFCGDANLYNWGNVGAYTLDNYKYFSPYAVTPVPFTATFGTQPAPTTVATNTAFVTSTVTNTAFASVQPAVTTTVTSASTTSTRTSTTTVTTPVTSPFTQTVTSCPTPSSTSPSPIRSSSSSSSPAPIASSSSNQVSTTTVIVVSTTTPSPSSTSRPTSVSSSSSSVATTTVVVVSTVSPTLSSSSSPSPIPSPSSSSSPSSVPSPSSSASPSPAPLSSSSVSPSPIPSPSSSSVATTTVVVVTTAIPTPSSTPASSSSPVPSSSSVRTSSSSASSSPASSSVTPTSASPAPSASALSCPASNGATFSTPHGNFIVECFVDRANNDIGIAPNNPATFEQCILACASNADCQDVSYLPNGPCYLKSGLGAPNSNGNVWGARVASVPVSSSAVVSTSSARSSSPAVATTTVVNTTVVTASSSSSSAASPAASVSCPDSNGATITANGRQYRVECGSDYVGGDIPGPMSPTYPGSYEKCLADCSSTVGCVAASYVIGGPCYLKDAVSGARTNANIIGGRLVSIIPTSAAPASSSAATSSRIASSSPAAATSSAPVTSATPSLGPSTVTVTTTISNTAYQCACTPTSVFNAPVASPTGAITCPDSNGSTFVTSCGAQYAIECGADRFGNDLTNGLVYTATYEQCLQACDTTPGCVNVSWVMGNPGACYMKGSSGAIQNNMNIIGGRKISGCATVKLHRKRVAVAAPKKKLAKRAGFFGPDFTFTQDRVIATATATVRSTVTTTSTPISGTTTQTVFTTASTTVTTTTSVPSTVYNIISITTCPTATPTV